MCVQCVSEWRGAHVCVVLHGMDARAMLSTCSARIDPLSLAVRTASLCATNASCIAALTPAACCSAFRASSTADVTCASAAAGGGEAARAGAAREHGHGGHGAAATAAYAAARRGARSSNAFIRGDQ